MGFAAPVGLAFAAFVEALAWLITAALLIVWDQTIGAAFRYIASVLAFTVHVPGIYRHHFNLGHPFQVADAAIVTWLKAERDGLSVELGWTLHALQETWHATASAVEWLTHETADTLEWIEGVKLPRWAKWAATAALPAALLTKLIAAAVAHLRPGLIREVKVIEHAIPAKAVTIIRKAAPLALPIPLGIPAIRKEIYGLTRRNLRLSKRLARVERLFGVAAMAAVMANVLGLPNWRCLTRGNIGRTSRALCGLPTHLLNDLLGILADVWILENVCVVLPFLETAASEIGTPLVEALTDVGAGICKGSHAPGALRGSTASLSPLVLSGASGLV